MLWKENDRASFDSDIPTFSLLEMLISEDDNHDRQVQRITYRRTIVFVGLLAVIPIAIAVAFGFVTLFDVSLLEQKNVTASGGDTNLSEPLFVINNASTFDPV